MKVCLHIHALRTGGAERQIVNLARELAGRGVEVVLLHAQKALQDSHYLQTIESHNVKLLSALSPEYLKEGIRLSRLHEDFFRNIPAASSLRMGILYLAGAFSLLRPDIVHSYLDMPNCTAGCGAVLAGVPAHLASFCSLDPVTVKSETAETTYPLYRYLLDVGRTHFEACSRAAARHYADWLGITPNVISSAHIGLDPAVYLAPSPQARKAFRAAHGIPPSAPVLLTLSRFDPCKAPESIVEVCARVLSSRPDCHCLITGAGMTEKGEMGAMVKERGLGEHVHLLGVQSDVASLLASTDVLLHPSRIEGFGIAIMEAMSLGVPAVASNVGGIPELVRHGQDGFLHDAADLEGMAESIVALVDDAGLRARLGRAGKERVLEEFSMKAMGDRALMRYEELLQMASREMA